MSRILLVDDDATSLIVARACLQRWDYQVMAVSYALQALSLLSKKDQNGEIKYDMVLADVHMPVMDGFQLLEHVHRDFNIPVVLISGDNKSEVVWKGLMIGAPAYLLKPIKADDVRLIWQFSVLWKNNACRRISQASVPRSICSSSTNTDKPPAGDVDTQGESKKLVWTPNLHNRFVEAILILGFENAVPKTILEVMNVHVPSLVREQVASHLQKFRKFLDRVLDNKASLDETSKHWIDCNYYSSIVGGNPNLILVNQRFEKRRTGKTPLPIPASLPLPPYNEAEASSSSRRNIAMLMQNGVTFQSGVNVATPTPGLGGGVTSQSVMNIATPTLGHGGVTFQNAVNVVATPTLKLGGVTSQSAMNVTPALGHGGVTFQNTVNVATPTLGLGGVTSQNNVNVATPTLGLGGVTSQSVVNLATPTLRLGGVTSQSVANVATPTHDNVTYNNPIQNQMGYFTNGGLIGGANSYMFPSTNYVAPSSGNNFNADLQVGNVQLLDPNLDSSYGLNQFENTFGINQQLGNVEPDLNIQGLLTNNMFSSTNPTVTGSGTTPVFNNFISEEPFNVGFQGSNVLFTGNNFNADLQVGNVELHDPNIGSSFGGNQFGTSDQMNQQLGNVELDPNIGGSFGENEFENIFAMPINEQASHLISHQQQILEFTNNNPGEDDVAAAADDFLSGFDQDEDWNNFLRNLLDEDMSDD